MVLWVNRLQMNKVLLYSIQQIHFKAEPKHTTTWRATKWPISSSFIAPCISDCSHTIQFHMLGEVNCFLWFLNTSKEWHRHFLLWCKLLFLFMSMQYSVTRYFIVETYNEKIWKKCHSKFREWFPSVLIPFTSTVLLVNKLEQQWQETLHFKKCPQKSWRQLLQETGVSN
jgi:hypothetical protein